MLILSLILSGLLLLMANLIARNARHAGARLSSSAWVSCSARRFSSGASFRPWRCRP